MILKAGSYSHRQGSVEVSIDYQDWRTDERQGSHLLGHDVTWSISGRLVSQASTTAAAQASIRSQTADLVDAYSSDGIDMKLLTPDGSKVHHQLLSSSTLDGTKISRPKYTDGTGPQEVVMRQFSLQVRGRVALSANNRTTDILRFEEELSFDQGPLVGHIETLTGLPVKQQLRRRSLWTAQQRGSAVGLFAYPTIPDPIWPAALVKTTPLYSKGSPKRDGTEWPISWTWVFESRFELTGNPHIPGVTY